MGLRANENAINYTHEGQQIFFCGFGDHKEKFENITKSSPSDQILSPFGKIQQCILQKTQAVLSDSNRSILNKYQQHICKLRGGNCSSDEVEIARDVGGIKLLILWFIERQKRQQQGLIVSCSEDADAGLRLRKYCSLLQIRQDWTHQIQLFLHLAGLLTSPVLLLQQKDALAGEHTLQSLPPNIRSIAFQLGLHTTYYNPLPTQPTPTTHSLFYTLCLCSMHHFERFFSCRGFSWKAQSTRTCFSQISCPFMSRMALLASSKSAYSIRAQPLANPDLRSMLRCRLLMSPYLLNASKTSSYWIYS